MKGWKQAVLRWVLDKLAQRYPDRIIDCLVASEPLHLHTIKRLVTHNIDLVLDAVLTSGKLRKAQRNRATTALVCKPVSAEQKAVFQKVQEYTLAYDHLFRWADQDFSHMEEKKQEGLVRALVSGDSVSDVLLDMVCEGNLCHLKNGVIEFLDRKQLWLMMEELLFEESYFIEFDTDAPFIVDCGVNIGLAIYYCKQRYPKARIVGFEPWSTAWDCAMRNVERNGWTDVTIHRAALSNREGQMEMTIVDGNSTAATLTNRMDEYIAVRSLSSCTQVVPVVRLAPYLSGPVDFLKMDIEGVEQLVLEDCGEALRHVKWLFVEYHYASQLKNNDLDQVISLLARHGFAMEIMRSVSYAKSKCKPFEHVGKRTAMLIYARRM